MKNYTVAFITILEIELEDLIEDIKILIADSELSKKQAKISNYVYMENLNLFQQELFGVNEILKKLKKLQPTDFASPQEVSSHLLDELKDLINRKLHPPVLLILVERKFNKVMKYLHQES